VALSIPSRTRAERLDFLRSVVVVVVVSFHLCVFVCTLKCCYETRTCSFNWDSTFTLTHIRTGVTEQTKRVEVASISLVIASILLLSRSISYYKKLKTQRALQSRASLKVTTNRRASSYNNTTKSQRESTRLTFCQILSPSHLRKNFVTISWVLVDPKVKHSMLLPRDSVLSEVRVVKQNTEEEIFVRRTNRKSICLSIYYRYQESDSARRRAEIVNKSVTELLEALRERKLTSEEIVVAFCLQARDVRFSLFLSLNVDNVNSQQPLLSFAVLTPKSMHWQKLASNKHLNKVSRRVYLFVRSSWHSLSLTARDSDKRRLAALNAGVGEQSDAALAMIRPLEVCYSVQSKAMSWV